jgi:hypothetical protein
MVAPPIGERAWACVAAAASTRTKAMRGRFIIQLLLVYDSSLRTGIILPGIAAALWW